MNDDGASLDGADEVGGAGGIADNDGTLGDGNNYGTHGDGADEDDSGDDILNGEFEMPDEEFSDDNVVRISRARMPLSDEFIDDPNWSDSDDGGGEDSDDPDDTERAGLGTRNGTGVRQEANAAGDADVPPPVLCGSRSPIVEGPVHRIYHSKLTGQFVSDNDRNLFRSQHH